MSIDNTNATPHIQDVISKHCISIPHHNFVAWCRIPCMYRGEIRPVLRGALEMAYSTSCMDFSHHLCTYICMYVHSNHNVCLVILQIAECTAEAVLRDRFLLPTRNDMPRSDMIDSKRRRNTLAFRAMPGYVPPFSPLHFSHLGTWCASHVHHSIPSLTMPYPFQKVRMDVPYKLPVHSIASSHLQTPMYAYMSVRMYVQTSSNEHDHRKQEIRLKHPSKFYGT